MAQYCQRAEKSSDVIARDFRNVNWDEYERTTTSETAKKATDVEVVHVCAEFNEEPTELKREDQNLQTLIMKCQWRFFKFF